MPATSFLAVSLLSRRFFFPRREPPLSLSLQSRQSPDPPNRELRLIRLILARFALLRYDGAMTMRLAALLLLAVLPSCAAAPGPPAADSAVTAPAEVTLAVGEAAAVEELRIRFDRVVSDSRCPAGVSCVWEGDAELLFIVNDVREVAVQLRLHTSARYATSASYGGYRVELVRLAPEPESNAEAKPSEYRATLRIEREPVSSTSR